ncbi:hypothetical protein HDF26_002104 [Pedobacter cryoconitis]|uniref:hypothetical protein n=1 Tax=Pedobacter cryoconitis TaxID=188932 RepID=UPI00160BEE1B|nr:hypothetical protein [Pedobacter cryoconitis]MBB6271647.1 hypothetical protein [Pedobacter cryoconitis]
MSYKLLLIFTTLFFQWPNVTKHWKSNDAPGYCNAIFEDFNGKQDFKVKLTKNEAFVFKYSATLTKGTLHLAVKSNSKTIYEKDISGTITDEVRVENPKGEKYKYTFTANHANGSFDVRY